MLVAVEPCGSESLAKCAGTFKSVVNILTRAVFKEHNVGSLDSFGASDVHEKAVRLELFDKRVPLEQAIKGDAQWLDKMVAETDFYQRIRVFLDAYTKAEKRREKPYGKKELVLSVKQMVYESDGKIKVSELKENTGYSERYINKVFLEEMGFSPKTFCKIIQFQRALEFLNYGAPDRMTDAAVALGYYDQAQFIRDFTRYAGITPKKYLKLVEERNYKSKIKQTNCLE